jgi:hypothetical protein
MVELITVSGPLALVVMAPPLPLVPPSWFPVNVEPVIVIVRRLATAAPGDEFATKVDS